jgi:hypothetical protein
MEMKYGTYVTFRDFFLIVCCTEECKRYTVCTKGWLDNIRNISYILLIIKVAQIFLGYILMLG